MNELLKENGIIQYKINLKKEQPSLNYDNIHAALNIVGLSIGNDKSTEEANTEFIKIMKNIDNSSMKIKTTDKKKTSEDTKPNLRYSEPVLDHDIKNFTKLFHPTKEQPDNKKPLKERLIKLNQLCQKMPFERSQDEVNNIFKILKTVSTLSCQVDDEMLKLLSNIVIYESISEPGISIFGNKGFYIILSGKIKPITVPFIRQIGEPSDRFTEARYSKDTYRTIGPGECFGTLDEIVIDGIDCSKLLLGETTEHSEYIFITTSYYRRVLEKYSTQRHADKLILLKTQAAFTLWPHQALVKIANIFSWTDIPANTLICKENEISPILAFVQEGSCNVLRSLKVKETLPNGKTVTKTKQVIVGTIGKNKSLGEVSLLDKTPMIHSLVAKENMKVMQSDDFRLQNLDNDVQRLLRQSCTAEFYHITKADVESIYIKQKSKKDWTNFKENVISEVIDSRGIQPHQGKWGKSPDPNDLF